VILTQLKCSTLLAHYTSGVTSICAVDVRRSEQDHICSAACLEGIVSPCNGTWAVSTDLIEFLLSSRGEQHLVNLDEDIYESLLIVLSFERIISF